METIDVRSLSGRERYQLLTSLVVPRPIAWVSTWTSDGQPNVAPFSYYAALSATPMLIGVSIGSRAGAPKDTLRNIRERRDFCVNLVTARHLDAMNQTAAELEPEADEFARAGLRAAAAASVRAPYVQDAPAVLECTLSQEVELAGSSNALVIGEVVAVRVAREVTYVAGTRLVDARALEPVARLWGDLYAMLGEIRALPRP